MLGPGKQSGGDELVALYASHVVSKYPAPTHVFLSLLHRTPLFVGTEMGIWVVHGDDIAFMGKPE